MMLAVKRVKLPASGWLNRQDKPLPRRGMFPVKICEIHSLGRYSREVFINRCSSAYRTPEMDTRKREENCSPPVLEFILLLSGAESATDGNGSCSRLIAVTANGSLINC